jgi:ribosomal protein S18 acetylase RimI-like enzyme
MTDDVTIRPAFAADLAAIKRALYLAATWRGEQAGWPQERVLAHSYFVQFWDDWGRLGDIAVVGECNGATLGAAFGWLFTADRHAHGFVDETTPEVGVGIEASHRRRGIGTNLLNALADVARADDIAALSLSVELGNPALRLYRRLGYVEIDRDEDAARMLLTL